MRNIVRSFLIVFFICIFSLTACANTGTSTSTNINTNSKFVVNYIDVGQGDSELIECNGEFMLVDAGESDKGSVVVKYLKSRGVNKLNYVIATHPHSDHIGGMTEVLNNFTVDNIILPKVNNTTKTYTNMLKAIQQKNIKAIEPKIGNSYQLGDSTFTVIGPKKYDTENMNNDSVAFRLVYGNNSFIFCGDAETAEESDILASGQTLKSDVYKVSHHGSTTSSSTAFLNAIQPKYAIIEVGKDNSYGHPKEKTLKALAKIGATVYRTDLNGNIVVTSDGKTLSFGNVAPAATSQAVSANTTKATTNTENSTESATKVISQSATSTANASQSANNNTYVLNTSSRKVHKSTCKSVSKMDSKNKQTYTGKLSDLISQGYSTCKVCNPT